MENSFNTLDLSSGMLDTLKQLGYKQMTPIQALALPYVLEGEDVIAKAKTGSGKSAAFGIGIIENIDVDTQAIQALILTPTRELAEQVAQTLRSLARHKENTKILALYGGVPLTPQAQSLEKGVHIVVGTPGRVEDHIGKGTIKLSQVRTIVLDEADRMLDMGFTKSVEGIISHTSKQRQTLLFSATFPEDIATLSQRIQNAPQELFIEDDEACSRIEEYFFTSPNDKFSAVLRLLDAFAGHSAILFCNTKEQCHALSEHLLNKNYVCKELHGDLEQRDRSEVLRLFTQKSIPTLIATDVAARGLDIDDVSFIVNVDFPFKPEVYLHRIGRTGRMERSGSAYSFISEKEKSSFEALAKYQQRSLTLTAFEKHKLTKMNPAVRFDTIMIYGGKKKKLRKGDIIGSLCQACGIDAKDIGTIEISDDFSYLAINVKVSSKVLDFLNKETIKNRRFKAKLLN